MPFNEGMAKQFRKTMLRVGVYESLDGTIVVTPKRLKHWANEVRRIQNAGYTIPVHWDHPDLADMSAPKRMSTSKGVSRSSQDTCGNLKNFRVTADGKAAELTIEATTPSAIEKLETNTVFVSPVLFDSWKDSKSNTYRDLIGSCDLVDYPVDHSQGPFVPVLQAMSCIRMSNSPTRYRMGPTMAKPGMTEEDEVDYEDTTESGDDGGMGSSVDMEPGTTAADDTTEPKPTEAPTTGTSVADVVALLAQIYVVLPDDTTTVNFLERLRPALMTAVAANAQPAPDEPATELPPEQMQQPQLAEQPQIATMSLANRIKKLEGEKIESARAALRRRAKALLDSGRCSPHEFKTIVSKVSVQKMSLTAKDTVSAGEAAVWIRAKEANPAGSVWTPSERVQRMSVKPVAAPTSWDAKATMTQSQEDEAVNALLKRK
jgi:hypothetical protein